MKRVLIIGVSSLIGTHLAIALRREFCVYGTYDSNKPRVDQVAHFRVPLDSGEKILRLVRFLKPEVIFYCAGNADEDSCRNDAALASLVNCEMAVRVAEVSRATGSHFIFFSSSKVFSGNRGNYAENDTPDPTTLYGRAKAQAEAQLTEFPHSTVLRLGNVFGLSAFPSRPSAAFNRVMASLWRGDRLRLIADEYRSFYGVENVVNVCRQILKRGSVPRGLFQVSQGGRDSHHSFASAVAEAMGTDPEKLTAVEGRTFGGEQAGLTRGRDLTLAPGRLESEFGICVTPLKDSLNLLQRQLAAGTY